MDDIIRAVAVYALPVILAITLHEAAHAYVAKYFGDDTAYKQGRMSLNPLRHIDPVGTILLPALMFVFTPFIFNVPFVFGYAKPVPVEISRLRKPKKQMAWVALAGPAANLAMAVLWLGVAVVLRMAEVAQPVLHDMAKAGVLINMLVMAFNLLPIPPLDGGRIVTSALPMPLANKFASIERFGFFIVLGLLASGLLHYWVQPVMLASHSVFNAVVF